MGFRAGIKRGGGFLANVDGELKGYEFSKRFKDEKKDGEWVYFVPSILIDGADDPIDQHMFIGAAERYAISDDGQELTMEDESPVTFGYTTPFGHFMDSLVEEGKKKSDTFEVDMLPDIEGGSPLNLSDLIGERFRFKQEVDEKGNAKFGKRKVKKNGKTTEYDRTNTVVEAWLGGSSNGNGKSSAKPSGKKSKASDEDTLNEEASDVLKAVLSKGPVARKNLSLPVTKALLTNKETGPAIKKIILDEDWQGEQDWLTVDKKGNLSVED